jgi:hypothetical protein
MAKTFITPEEDAEYQALGKAYHVAHAEFLRTRRTGGKPLTGEAQRKHLAADEEVAKIVRRMKEIKGISGPWNA